MQALSQIDWQKMFIPEQPPFDVVIRGTIVYLMLFLTIRFVLKRRAGGLGLADVLVVVLIADAVQNAMGSDYKSVTEGALLVGTIVFWEWALDWIGDHVSWLRRLTRPAPLLLIEDGKLLPRNMRHEMITKEELLSQLRHEGIEDPGEVRRAFLEGDGKMSVLRRVS